MRVWAAHAVFATVLVGSLVARARPPEAPIVGASVEPVILSVARSQGLAFREYRASNTGWGRTIVFDAPGCSRPVWVTSRPLTFEDQAAIEVTTEQGYQQQYVFIDRKWNSPDRWAVSIQRMKYSLLAMFGLTEYAPWAFALQVETPRDCPAAESLDWRPAWSRTYLTASEATAQKR
jgi:hypothetical protein